MKKELRSSQKFLAIKKVLEKHPAIFENKPEATLARDGFITKATELAGRINELVRPVSALLVNRRNQREEIFIQMRGLINLGLLLASRKPDPELEAVFASYNRRIQSLSAPMMIEVGQDVLTIIGENAVLAGELGLLTENHQTIAQQLASFQLLLDSTQERLDTRRETRVEIEALIRTCNQMLRSDLDRFARFNQLTYPAFYDSYIRLRRTPTKRTGSSLPANSDISGLVSDATTGLPIEGATIDLIEHGFAMNTLADGKYLLDELEPGTYNVSCHAPGYEVPPQGVFDLTANDSVVHHFVLTPIVG